MLDSAVDLLRRQASGDITAVEIAEQAIAQIEASQPVHNAFTHVAGDAAIAAAQAVDQRRQAGAPLGPLAGIPVAVKDVLCTHDMPTTCSSNMLRDFHPPYDATVVAKLRAADAVIVGKTNMDEFAMGASTETGAFGITRNPWDTDRTPGGSSGGATACVAAGCVPLSLGSDTGGSIRQPAAFCGVTGLKPTYGRVSRYGLIAFASSLDQVGPIAWSVEDAALLLQAIAGFEPRDSTSLDRDVPSYTDILKSNDLRGLRIGVTRAALDNDGIEDSVRTAVLASIDVFLQQGAEIVDVDLPHSEYWVPTYYVIAPSEASSNLSRYDGAHYGHRTASLTPEIMVADDQGDAKPVGPLVTNYCRSREEGFGREVKRRIMVGTYALSEGYADQYYNQALKARRLIRGDYDAAFTQVDLLLGPVTPTPAFKIGEKVDDPIQMYLCDLFTVGANLAGVPALSLPAGLDETGLPLGIQLQAPALEETRLLFAGAAFQSVTDYHQQRPLVVVHRVMTTATEHTFQTVIGLEVHVQLKTQSKLFCGCSTDFGAPPNTQVCPVCLGLPGALPVMNEAAIDLSIRTGLALSCSIPPLTKWDRKQYFYPDLPKGYQISQFDLPICADGYLEIADPANPEATRHIGIIRAHLEEDAGKSMHDEAAGKGDSRIDLNRCGTPLLEIVSQPDLRSAAEAKEYLTQLKLLLTHLEVSDCEMQEGSLRVDANVNLHLDVDGKRVATPIVEVKNMNSFRAVERALEYEVRRQYIDWEVSGKTIEDEPKTTRGWDDGKEETFLQREKELSADYRYFPDPDLLPIRLPSERIEAARRALGELPAETRERLQGQYGIKPYDADVIVHQGRHMIDYFETVADVSGDGKRTSAWIQQDVLRTMKDRQLAIDGLPITPQLLGQLIKKVAAGELDNARARDVFAHLLDNDVTVDDAVTALGITAVDSSELDALCQQLIEANPKVVEDVLNGNEKAVGALIGQAKKKNPNANPQAVRETLLRLIKSS